MSDRSERGGDQLTYREWAAALEDGDLLGQRCDECGHETAAPKAACARCGSRAVETVELPTRGTVVSETTIAVAPADFEGEYRVALIDLGDARVLARLEGDAEIGDEVTFAGVSTAGDDPAPLFS